MPLLIYASVPRANGMFTFYQNLRVGLQSYGWQVYCITIGAQEHHQIDPIFHDEHCISLVPTETDFDRQIAAFTAWCEENSPQIIMPMDSEVVLRAMPRLAPEIRIVTRCAYTSDYGYRLATYHLDRLARIVALTPKHIADLIERYHIPEEKITLIPHGVDLVPFAKEKVHNKLKPLQIAFLGRLEHRTKGILHIPGILEKLDAASIPYQLRIAGSGWDGERLRRRLAHHIADEKVVFTGTISSACVPEYLTRADVFLFTSHEEGFSWSLMEAMAAGCVPVASYLEGCTDFIINDTKTGFLCPVGDADAFSAAIMNLHDNRDRLRRMSRAAQQQIKQRFSIATMSAHYAELFNAVINETITTH